MKAGNATFFSTGGPPRWRNQGGLIFDVFPASSGNSHIIIQSGSGSTVDPKIEIVFLVPFDGVGLSTEALPTSIDPVAWENAAIFVTGPSPDGSLTRDVSGEITSFSVVVPEAGSISIWSGFAIFGFVVAWLWGRPAA